MRIKEETGCAMLVIEHDMPLITGISDRMIALELGAVVTEGTPDEVIRDPRVIESYLGGDVAAIQRSGAAKAPATKVRTRKATKAPDQTAKAPVKSAKETPRKRS